MEPPSPTRRSADPAEVYDGTVGLAESGELGGLRARLRLPAASGSALFTLSSCRTCPGIQGPTGGTAREGWTPEQVRGDGKFRPLIPNVMRAAMPCRRGSLRSPG